jgi:hypothetical protein
MKNIFLSFILILSVFELFAQQDIAIGYDALLNLQRKNVHGDGWILHNAEYSRDNDILKWKKTHGSLGSRGIRFSYSSMSGIHFYADNKASSAGKEFTPTTRFFIGNNGKVGVGTTSPGYKLDVLGTIRAQEVKVDMYGADFVFEEDYHLRPIEEVEQFVKERKHLPEIAPAKEMQEMGVNQSEMNQQLLQKIEELTLYLIEQNKETKNVLNELSQLKRENEKLKNRIVELETK